MKRFAGMLAVFALFAVCPSPAHAKIPPKIMAAVVGTYPPAEDHPGLQSAHEEPIAGKLHGYVVVEQGGIPAERARFLISWEQYDYRGAVVDLRKGGLVETRRGEIYTYLQRGDVMAVAGIKEFAGTIYLKLLSADVYTPENRRSEKRHSRVTVMLGFRLPKEVLAGDDAEWVLGKMKEWLKPFQDVDAAKAYAAKLTKPAESDEAQVSNKKKKTETSTQPPAAKEKPAEQQAVEKKAIGTKGAAAKDSKTEKVSGTAAAPSVTVSSDEAAADERLEGLEKKIEEARQQMEEAEQEMQKIREQKKKGK